MRCTLPRDHGIGFFVFSPSLKASSCPYTFSSTQRTLRCGAGNGDAWTGDDSQEPTLNNGKALSSTIRRRYKQIEVQLEELGLETLEQYLQSACESPARPAYRLSQLIQDTMPQGRPVLLLELSRPSPSSTSSQLAALAAEYVAAGADALVVCTDAADTPEGLKDLLTVCRAVKVPVLRKDWILHPLQVVEAKEAGAAGVLGAVTSVLGRGAPILTSFAAAVGLDAALEVVNLAEVRQMEAAGVPLFAIHESVSLALSVPGLARDVTQGLIKQLPPGAGCLVGVRTPEEARQARLAGADALLLKRECLLGFAEGVGDALEYIRFITSGDD